MALNGSIQKSPPGIIGFDLDTKLNRVTAKQFYAHGYRFCLRYITRASDVESPNDLTEAEAIDILDAGLALMAVQHFPGEGWRPTADLGRIYGRNAAANAGQAGLPEGINVFLDLEGIASGTPSEDVIAFCNAWFSEVETVGYVSGVYVGANAILSGDELYWDLRTKHYWKSGSRVPDIPHRGYQMIQSIKPGQTDKNVTLSDAFGSGVLWLSRSTGLIS
jgi:hypothetical protein